MPFFEEKKILSAQLNGNEDELETRKKRKKPITHLQMSSKLEKRKREDQHHLETDLGDSKFTVQLLSLRFQNTCRRKREARKKENFWAFDFFKISLKQNHKKAIKAKNGQRDQEWPGRWEISGENLSGNWLTCSTAHVALIHVGLELAAKVDGLAVGVGLEQVPEILHNHKGIVVGLQEPIILIADNGCKKKKHERVSESEMVII